MENIMAVPGANDEQKQIMTMDENIEVVIQRAEKQVEILKKVLGIALKRLSPLDWVDQQGKPYLAASGAEKLMPLFGISVYNTSYEKKFSEDDNGQSYVYSYKGTFAWGGGSIEALGACSSRDKFFAWDSKEQTYKPLSQVDETNIMKSAYTNMIANGITRLLGIRNLTWEQLKEFGVDQEKAAKVQYGGKKATDDEVTKWQNEIDKWLLEMCYNDKNKALNYLITLTAFTAKDGKEIAGVNTVKRLTGQRLNIAHSNAKKEYENWKRSQEAE